MSREFTQATVTTENIRAAQHSPARLQALVKVSDEKGLWPLLAKKGDIALLEEMHSCYQDDKNHAVTIVSAGDVANPELMDETIQADAFLFLLSKVSAEQQAIVRKKTLEVAFRSDTTIKRPTHIFDLLAERDAFNEDDMYVLVSECITPASKDAAPCYQQYDYCLTS